MRWEMSHAGDPMKPPIQYGFHEDLTRSTGVRAASDRQFGVVAGVFLVAVAVWPALRHGKIRVAVLGAGLAIWLVAAVAPLMLHPLNRAWTALGLLLARVMNPVVMAALFFLVFTPMGLLLRLLGKDPLRLRRSADATYWIERKPPGPPPETMANQF